MQLITDQLIKSLAVRDGIESIKNDIELLEQFKSHATGCGLESLDTISGKLIEKGLAERYPNYFTVGSGLEGIGTLVDTLKKGLASIKKLGRKGLKPVVKDTTKKMLDEVRNTYANQKWIDEKSEKTGMVSVKGITFYTGSADDLAGLIKGAKHVFDTFNSAVEDCASQTSKAWGVVSGGAVIAEKAGDDKEKQAAAYEQFIKVMPESPRKTLPLELPKLDLTDNGGKLPALSKAEVKQVGDVMVMLIEGIYEIYHRAENSRLQCGFSDEELDALPKSKLVQVLFEYGHWENINDNVTYMSEKAEGYLLKMTQGFEAYVLSSIK